MLISTLNHFGGLSKRFKLTLIFFSNDFDELKTSYVLVA